MAHDEANPWPPLVINIGDDFMYGGVWGCRFDLTTDVRVDDHRGAPWKLHDAIRILVGASEKGGRGGEECGRGQGAQPLAHCFVKRVDRARQSADQNPVDVAVEPASGGGGFHFERVEEVHAVVTGSQLPDVVRKHVAPSRAGEAPVVADAVTPSEL